MAGSGDFNGTFEKLKGILQPFAPSLIVKADEPGNYYLDTPFTAQYQKALMFGSVQIKKNYVSFYLFPIYMYPDLLDDLSVKLKKRMQGKSCFHFTSIDDTLLAELADLTRSGFERFQQENVLSA